MNETFRQHFPALRRQHEGRPLVFLDGPAGVQVPRAVIDAIADYYRQSNANTHGAFVTSRETDSVVEEVRVALSDFLGAAGPHTISLGQNMTSLNYSLARAIGRVLQAGDEILITQLDHEGNRGPWLALREWGVVVREVRLLPNGRLDYVDLERQINHRTRLVALGHASNMLGTVNDIAHARRLCYRHGAWLLLDAVHYAPHFSIDVQADDCDFLLCSAYKFYGPHVGVLYARPGLLDRLPCDRLRTAEQHAPQCIETGTLNHAALAGVTAAIDFIAELGEGVSRRARLISAMSRIQRHEFALGKTLYDGLLAMNGVRVIGPDFDDPRRAPTLAVIVEGRRPRKVCERLAELGICAWDGHFYALRAAEALGLAPQGGVIRLGISAYTTAEEVKSTLVAIESILEE
jgi:cysteine desulfurase family protein (TIGR01976 family)